MMNNGRILVIEDDRDLRESIVEILVDDGFTVHSAGNAEESYQVLQEESIEMVIVDYMMPGTSGLALIPVIKKQNPLSKVVMVTAFATIENAVLAMKSGADEYLAKPFKRDELLVIVKRLFEELKFERNLEGPHIDQALTCLSNQIRRDIISILFKNAGMRFMDITRELEIEDHTKVNFHIKRLKADQLVTQDRDKYYHLTEQGRKIFDVLTLMSKQIIK